MKGMPVPLQDPQSQNSFTAAQYSAGILCQLLKSPSVSPPTALRRKPLHRVTLLAGFPGSCDFSAGQVVLGTKQCLMRTANSVPKKGRRCFLFSKGLSLLKALDRHIWKKENHNKAGELLMVPSGLFRLF